MSGRYNFKNVKRNNIINRKNEVRRNPIYSKGFTRYPLSLTTDCVTGL